MAKRNIFSMLNNPKASIGRNGFDLSHRKVFTAKAGELLPILCEDVVPGDYFEIDTATLVRTLPLNTAAFLRAKCCFDFFFVPKTKLWSNYDAFISQRGTVESSALHGYAYEPNITLSVLNEYVNEGTTNVKDSKEGRAKILELLGYGDGMKTLPEGLDPTKSLTALPIAGYNSIYNWYYRNAWRDEPSEDALYSSNLDNYTCTTYANSLITNGDTNEFVKVHYHGWYKDLFMGSLPNQQFGVISSVNSTSNFINSSNGSNLPLIVAGSASTPAGLSAGDVYNPYDNSYFSNNLTFGIKSSFDVLALRKALALQKWKEYNMRAGWKSKYQQRAMFGVDAPHDAKHEIDFIDSHEQIIQISEVISTANTSSPESGNGNLADIAGKGISADGGRKIKYSVNQHGYIYCIFYVMPETEYDSDMIDRNLVRSEPFDHYTPAFENLGMQAIFKHELNYKGNPNYFDTVLGYAPNYYEYKTRTDKVYGTLKTNGSLSPWVSVRRDLQNIINQGTIPTSYFYVNPSVLDTIFSVSADKSLDTDQFICNCNFDIKAVRPMSVLGLPQL